MADSLTLHCTLSSDVIPASDQPRLLYLLLEVSGGEGAQTLPSNLGFIIDTSDSMHIRLVSDEQFLELAKNGQAQEIMTDGVPAYQITSITNESLGNYPRRIDYVSKALMVASEYLRPVDRFTLVAFASRAHRMITSAPGSERARLQQAARELEYMRLGDETQMAEGIAMAFNDVMHQVKQSGGVNYANRLILLTDGHTKNVKACYNWAKQARKAGLTLSTLGIGSEFNEDLLIPLADMTGGNAYYIETPERLPEAFGRELGSALRISYRNVEIKIKLFPGVELRRVHRVKPQLSEFDPGPDMEGSYALLLGDYDPALSSTLLVEFIVPPRPVGTFRIAQAMLIWDDPETEEVRSNQRQDLIVQVSEAVSMPLKGRVMNIIERVSAYRIGIQALDAAQSASQSLDSRDKHAATIQLRQAATRLLDVGEQGLADSMLNQAEILDNGGRLDPNATKKIRYETRSLSQSQ